jgi:SAM-dependent methyltransferase
MSLFEKDPIGHAIHDFVANNFDENIVVKSSICDDDVIPVAYLFRGEGKSEFELTSLEKMALEHCKGRVLDVGGGAGIHANILSRQGSSVQIIDTSHGAVAYHKSLGLNSRVLNFFDLANENYDTLLFLMNGLGIAGRLSNLTNFLQKCYDLLDPGGQVIADSTDIKYLYEDEEGGYWMDLNSAYYGDFDFQMCYKDTCTEPFEWLYVDFQTLKSHAEPIGFTVKKLNEFESQYLVQLTK